MRVYKYYIWSADEESDDDLQLRIEEAIDDSGTLLYEFDSFEDS